MALNETASKRGHNYVTVFIDLDRKHKPVIFITPGKSKGCLVLLRRFLREHGGDHNNITEVVCDMSPAFLAAIGKNFPGANVTVDWFAEIKERKLPKATRWVVLKAADGGRLTEKQQQALTKLETSGFAIATA
ncbi:hypothetical protein DFAR_3720004 [Desulfarculales bacterium]